VKKNRGWEDSENHQSKLVIESQPANRKSLINLSRQNWCSELVTQLCLLFFNSHGVYSFTTSRSTKYLFTPESSLFNFQSVRKTFLTYTCLQTGQEHSSSLPHSVPHHTHHPPSEEVKLCATNRSFSVFMFTTSDTFLKDIPVSHLYSPSTS
jgi:hypothetical protein